MKRVKIKNISYQFLIYWERWIILIKFQRKSPKSVTLTTMIKTAN